MSLTNPKKVVTEERLADFYQSILPYLGGMPDVCGGGFAPIGTIIAFMGTTAPQDYLACDGTVYNIADYPRLAQFFTDQFGSANYFGGNGTTTFAVPDLRGEFLRGKGTATRNTGSGGNVGTHQDGSRLPIEVGNTTNNRLEIRGVVDGSSNIAIKDGDKIYAYSDVSSPQKITFTNGSTSAMSSGNVYATMRPTNTSILWCIKAVEPGEVYSTSERIVGTWIDGKPLYQKVIVDTMPTSDGQIASKQIDIGASVDFGYIKNAFFQPTNKNINNMEFIDGTLTRIVYAVLYPNNGASIQNKINVNSNVASYSGMPVYFIVCYTKTT